MGWTDRQKSVIEARDRDILVSAAAGSGKTTVLVERIIEMLEDPDSDVNINEFLIVTFTRNAASEMKEKIRKRLTEALENDPSNEHLRKQMSLIYDADISTIDSFAKKIVSEHFEESGIDIDPNFRLMDEIEESMLIEDKIVEVLDECFAKGDKEFNETVEILAEGTIKTKIESKITKIIKSAEKQPFPLSWLNNIKNKNTYDTLEEFENSKFIQDSIKLIKEKISGVLVRLEGEVDVVETLAKKTTGYDVYMQAIDTAKAILEYDTYSQIREAIVAFDTSKQTYWRKKELSSANAVFKDEFKPILRTYHNPTKNSSRYMEKIEDLFELTNRSQMIANVLIDLAIATLEKVEKEKKRVSAYSFSDIEHFAIKILCVEEKNADIDKLPKPTKTAQEIAKQYKEVIIDEYQDSNRIQEFMLSALSRGHGINNMFMVGDVKQSIYRFRSAEPELFLKKYNDYSYDENAEHRKIVLDSNFRSRPEIINSTNRIFDAIMQTDVGGIDYTDGNRLVFASENYDLNCNTDIEDNKTEFHVLYNLDEEKNEIEARYIANRIRQLVDSNKGLKISEKKENKRNVRYKDIVILTKAPASIADTYLRVFDQYNIPVFAESKDGFFNAIEIKTVLDYLYIIDNPRQDLALASVLKSVMYDFSDGELARIKVLEKSTRNKNIDCILYDALLLYANKGDEDILRKKCAEFIKDLEWYRNVCKYMSVYELINTILDKTGFEYYVSSLPAGKRRKLNLDLLVEYAYDYENTSYRGLFNFVRFVEKNIEQETRKGEAVEVSSEDDVVRIVSIHKSKGLEYPVVFLANCNKTQYKGDDAPELIDKYGNISVAHYDPIAKTKSDSFLKVLMENEENKALKAEEIRLLYVAMTRAKEKLILTSTIGNKMADRKKEVVPPYDKVLSDKEILDTSGYYKLMIKVLASEVADLYPDEIDEDAPPIIKECEGDFRFVFVPNIKNVLLNKLYEQDVIDIEGKKNEIVDRIKKNFEQEYPYKNNRKVKAKFSVTELKNNAMRENKDEDAVFFVPDTRTHIEPEFIKNNKEDSKLSGASLGTVYHKIFEVLDFDRDYNSLEDVSEFLNTLVDGSILEANERNQIDDQKIYAFIENDLFQDMKTAYKDGNLYREQKFIMEADAKSVYPNEDVDGNIVLQGIIDAYYVKDGKVVILDYKTDNVEKLEELTDKYSEQPNLYKDAIEKVTDYDVSQKIIYSVKLNDVIEC